MNIYVEQSIGNQETDFQNIFLKHITCYLFCQQINNLFIIIKIINHKNYFVNILFLISNEK